ncbi:MAG: aldehyde dehydrogenase family protein, partial [Actinobacteria bacterium]|nr:aldehyde dehydrogenase family protein [Actinomycetota bacterium]
RPAVPAPQPHPGAVHRGRRRGRDRILREEGGRVEGPLTTPSMLRPLVDDLHARRQQARQGGGEEKVAKQHAAGKLTARERLDLLMDEGTFTELGIHGQPHFSQQAMAGREAPADGVITGYGRVDGRFVAVAAYDSLDEAIRLANDSRYGLQAAIFTNRLADAMTAFQSLDFGGVLVNEVPTWRADQQPYGGVRDSGNTREGPAYSIREMTELRMVVLSP